VKAAPPWQVEFSIRRCSIASMAGGTIRRRTGKMAFLNTDTSRTARAQDLSQQNMKTSHFSPNENESSIAHEERSSADS
jgi:hypothetical protein